MEIFDRLWNIYLLLFFLLAPNDINIKYLDDYRNSSSSWNSVTVKSTDLFNLHFYSYDISVKSKLWSCRKSWQFSLYIRSNYGVCSMNFFQDTCNWMHPVCPTHVLYGLMEIVKRKNLVHHFFRVWKPGTYTYTYYICNK